MSQLALAVGQPEALADGAELLQNQSEDMHAPSGCVKIASRRRHVSDHLEQIKSYQDANSSGRKGPQLETQLTQQKAATHITVHLNAVNINIASILHAQSGCAVFLCCLALTQSAQEFFQAINRQ